jgi:hypothetical protein
LLPLQEVAALTTQCWREVVHRVLHDVKTAPGRESCAHNLEFWASQLLLTTQSDAWFLVCSP